MSEQPAAGADSHFRAFSKHRLEGLTDGIYAVAMTLLAIDLKFAESVRIADEDALVAQLVHLLPQFVSWALSFVILSIFWFSHQKAFFYTRAIDGRLIAINLVSLAFITLLPFASMLIGVYPAIFGTHVAYAIIMAVLAVLSIRQIQYVAARPALAQNGLSTSVVRGVEVRCWGLVLCALLSVVVAWFHPLQASTAFMAMAIITPLSRLFERRAAPDVATPPAS